MAEAHIDALVVSDQPLHLANRRLIVSLAAEASLLVVRFNQFELVLIL
jgi:hypothetical protein